MECQEVNVWAGDISHRVHALEAAINPVHTERVSADSAALADGYVKWPYSGGVTSFLAATGAQCCHDNTFSADSAARHRLIHCKERLYEP